MKAGCCKVKGEFPQHSNHGPAVLLGPYSTKCGTCRWTSQAGVPVSALATPSKQRRVLVVAKPNHLSGFLLRWGGLAHADHSINPSCADLPLGMLGSSVLLGKSCALGRETHKISLLLELNIYISLPPSPTSSFIFGCAVGYLIKHYCLPSLEPR